MEAYSPFERTDSAASGEAEANAGLACDSINTVALTNPNPDLACVSWDISSIRSRIGDIFRNSTSVCAPDRRLREPNICVSIKFKASAPDPLQKELETLREGRSMGVRSARHEDIEQLVDVDLLAFRSVYRYYDIPPDELKTELLDKFKQRYDRVGNKWITVLERDNKIVGFLMACPTSKPPEEFISWEDTTDNGTLKNTYDRNGQFLYVVSLSVTSEGSKLAGQDMLMVDLISKIIEGNYLAYFESRLPGLKRWMLGRCREDGQQIDSLGERQKQEYAEEYFRLNTNLSPGEKPIDPLLKILHDMGSYFSRLVPNAYQDELSMNYGVVATYESPLPSFVRRSPTLRKGIALAVRSISKSNYLTQKVF
ncbi:hypothetical protein A3E49_02480 [Candidatus Saccharibacteria bacterium RIFCSPHIGHO2_12_FULL_49_19]|nr:MAG: hypothetical protein A2708_00150 [Candidatus Saccharibacteria bacterium RIFCSPHIGHO2_01_FULL_49_21]OGL37843.1 MAG: hypothetical protein A3E49_02480 [Candidatus Saccharibacteria bacterium RIFCSPHIGHO2_12_FULL_49_19]OGL38334.1 MAG: hypothetical protein A3B63_03530 [Candidatus Saccharibacteria bacterium RIFCSPLOWO2_01_FULL_49_22]